MAKLNIEQTHALPLEEVKKRLQELAHRLSAKYGIDAQWTSDREAKLKRTGVSGVITLAEDKVAVLLDLSFALIELFKDLLDGRIR